MRKYLSKLFLLFLLVPILFSSATIHNFYIPKAQQTNNGNFIIYVNATIAPSLQPEIQQYKTDVEAEGYTVKIYNWSDANPDPLQRAINLKFNMTQEYQTYGLNGTVLIGKMPYAEYQDSLYTYICDLFLMDMDGTWSNLDGDLDFENHFNGTGNMYPEIFVGRINPYPINKTGEIPILKKYFQRNHDFRVGITSSHNNSLMYIDDDWESYSHEWKSDMEFLYSNITLINNTIETTNSTNYLKEIIKPYDFSHVFIHSDYEQHYFKNGTLWGVDGAVHSLQLKTVNLSSKFYMLYCCFAAQFNWTDNIATQYLFAPKANNSLVVFGASTSGGFQMNQYLYEPLGQGWTFGESFKNWWYNDILDPIVKTHGPTDPTVRGNMLLGDPTLRIRDPAGGREPPPSPILTPLQLSLIVVGPIIVVGLISVIIVSSKNRKAKKQS